MGMETYLEKLKQYLGNIGQDEKEEIINDFREHFLMAVRQGKTEEEVCWLLGSPEEIARQYVEGVGEAIPYGKFPEGYGYETEVNIHERFPVEQIREIKTDFKSCSIQVKGITQGETNDEITVDIEGKTIIPFEVRITDGTLTISQRIPGGNDFFLSRVFNLKQFNAEAKILIPQNYTGIIDLTSSNGSIQMEGLSKLTSGKIKTGSGNIKITDATGEFEVSTGSGNINMNGFSGTLQARTGSGSVHTEIESLTGKSSFSTGSGGVHLQAERVTSDIQVRTGSGGIEINIQALFAGLRASTGVGNVQCTFGENSPIAVSMKSGMGKCENEFATSNGITHKADLKTGLGSIKVKKTPVQ